MFKQLPLPDDLSFQDKIHPMMDIGIENSNRGKCGIFLLGSPLVQLPFQMNFSPG